MSTSRHHVVGVDGFLEDFPNQEDVLRYTLTSSMPENKDSDFSWKDLQAKNNNELVAIFGNFVNRILVLCHKYFGGTIPEISEAAKQAVTEKATEINETLANFPAKYDACIHAYEFRNALTELMNVARAGNKFLTDLEPWKLVKTDKEQTAAVLSKGLEVIAFLAVYAVPFLPFTTPKLQSFLQLSAADIQAILQGNFSIKAGHSVTKPSLLFPKIDDKALSLIHI